MNKTNDNVISFSGENIARLCERLKLEVVDNLFLEYNPDTRMYEAMAIIHRGEKIQSALSANKSRRAAIVEAIKTCLFKYKKAVWL